MHRVTTQKQKEEKGGLISVFIFPSFQFADRAVFVALSSRFYQTHHQSIEEVFSRSHYPFIYTLAHTPSPSTLPLEGIFKTLTQAAISSVFMWGSEKSAQCLLNPILPQQATSPLHLCPIPPPSLSIPLFLPVAHQSHADVNDTPTDSHRGHR